MGIYQIILSPDWYYNTNIKLIDEALTELSNRSINKDHLNYIIITRHIFLRFQNSQTSALKEVSETVMSLVNLDCHCCILLGIDNQTLSQTVGSPGPQIKSAQQFRNLKREKSLCN